MDIDPPPPSPPPPPPVESTKELTDQIYMNWSSMMSKFNDQESCSTIALMQCITIQILESARYAQEISTTCWSNAQCKRTSYLTILFFHTSKSSKSTEPCTLISHNCCSGFTKPKREQGQKSQREVQQPIGGNYRTSIFSSLQALHSNYRSPFIFSISLCFVLASFLYSQFL